MKKEDTKLYTSPEVYFDGPDGMKNEVTMWYVAAGLLMREVSIKKGNLPYGGLGKKIGYDCTLNSSNSLELLDLCSGPGNFVNHLNFVFPWLKVTCVDLNKVFLNVGKSLFKKYKFIEADVTKLNLKKKFDCVTASSAYHHIEDKFKLDFLKIITNHLKDDGFVIICENFLPEYTDKKTRDKSIQIYYKELGKYYQEGNATDKSLMAIDEVYALEKSGVEEHKVTHSIFLKHIRESGLFVDSDIIVWQPKTLRASNAGSHVFIIKKGDYKK